MSERTPGDWHVGSYGQVVAHSGRVADCLISGMHVKEVNANARFIAAGPDMFKALEDIAGMGYGRGIEARERARAAIAEMKSQ